MPELKLSIIIPCYNCESTLREALESCYRQGFNESEFEVVMVDDKSKDGTRQLMEQLAREHSNIKIFFHDKNKGGGATRNTATKHTSSDIVHCVDSDNLLPDHTLPPMLAMLLEKNCDGIGINRSLKFSGTDKNNIVRIDNFGYAGKTIPVESLLQKDESEYCSLYSTFMIKKSSFEAIGGYPEHHGFDTQGLAWRFLAGGLIAYTCPNTADLHRIGFNDSYYLREQTAGKINYNWQDVLVEHLNLFDEDTQKFIVNYDCKDFSKNLFEDLKKRDKIFKPNVHELLGKSHPKDRITLPPRVYIQRNSPRGIYIRIRTRIKQSWLRATLIYVYWLVYRFHKLFTEGQERNAYYENIETIKQDKKIVVDLSFGGIGDCLAWSTLPRLLKEQCDIDFYLSEKSLGVLRNKDTLKLVFEMNPYFKGVSKDSKVFRIEYFEREKNLYTFITDRGGLNIIETLEKQFGVSGQGRPEMYYAPKDITSYKNVVLVDENTISGKKFGWIFEEKAFLNEALKHKTALDVIEYVDTKKQDLFTYVDMIYSCKHFVATFSGGASIAACFDKPFSVIWPKNGKNGSNYQFRYKSSKGKYI